MRRITITFLLLVLCSTVAIAVGSYRDRTSGAASSGAQDPAYLDRRISLLEQRLNILDSNVSRLQQQVMSLDRAPAQPARDSGAELLRAELNILKSRLSEVECGVVHLDERTLSAAAKEAQKRTTTQAKDPCRLFPDAPVELSPRR